VSAILVLDTSSEIMHVGLRIADQTWSHASTGGARASAELVPAIFGLLECARARMADLDAVAFGCGPGAFTGLRTACSVAQGLALGAAKPVLAIDTLLAIAEDARQGSEHFQAWSATDARMDQIYAARYLYAAGRWSVLDAPMLVSVDDLNRLLRQAPPQDIAGNASSAFAGRLDVATARLHGQAAPRAEALLVLAQQLWDQGAARDAGQAMPLYVRDKVAHTTAERAAAKRLDPGASAVAP
jgi:tRNA threonylcarbamoyladenosine biosynthesis protein TsaB